MRYDFRNLYGDWLTDKRTGNTRIAAYYAGFATTMDGKTKNAKTQMKQHAGEILKLVSPEESVMLDGEFPESLGHL